jgi:hypothetical protein
MPPKKITRQRPAAAKLRSWAVTIIRSKGEYLGSVEAPAGLPLSQFPVLIAVIRRVPLALRTLENIRGGAVAEGADECRQFQFATAPLARRHLWCIHAALTADGQFRSGFRTEGSEF